MERGSEDKILDKTIEHIVDGFLTKKNKEIILEEHNVPKDVIPIDNDNPVEDLTLPDSLPKVSSVPPNPNPTVASGSPPTKSLTDSANFRANAAKLQSYLLRRPDAQSLRELNILKERNDALTKAILRDQLGGKLASSWAKQLELRKKDDPPTTSSPKSELSDTKDSSSKENPLLQSPRTRREEVATSLAGKLMRRPSINSLRRRHILVDGDPTFHARKQALKHLFIERTLNDQLAKKYELVSKTELEELPVPDSGLALTLLEGASMEKRSRFIKEQEDKGLFVCHHCCTTEYYGVFPNSFASRKYPFFYFFEEIEAKQVGIRPAVHHEIAKREHLCNVCYGVCSCGQQFSTESPQICTNCGGLGSIKYEKVADSHRTFATKTKSKDLAALERSKLEGVPQENLTKEQLESTQSTGRHLVWKDSKIAGKMSEVKMRSINRYLFFNHFTEERYILIVRSKEEIEIQKKKTGSPNVFGFFLQKDDGEDAIEPTAVVSQMGFHWIYFRSPSSQTQQVFICTIVNPDHSGEVLELPPNQAGIFLQDGINPNYLYYADKNICEYFLWNKLTGERWQVS